MTVRKREWFDEDAFWIELYPFLFTQRRFSEAVLEQLGFCDVRLHGNLDGDEYGLGAERLIAVARKPEPATTGRRTHPSSRRPAGRG